MFVEDLSSQERPRTSQDLFKTSQDSPRTSQDTPKVSQAYPQSMQRLIPRLPEAPQGSLELPKHLPRLPGLFQGSPIVLAGLSQSSPRAVFRFSQGFYQGSPGLSRALPLALPGLCKSSPRSLQSSQDLSQGSPGLSQGSRGLPRLPPHGSPRALPWLLSGPSRSLPRTFLWPSQGFSQGSPRISRALSWALLGLFKGSPMALQSSRGFSQLRAPLSRLPKTLPGLSPCFPVVF